MNKFQKTKFIRPSFLGRAHYKSIGYINAGKARHINEEVIAALKLAGCTEIFHEYPKHIKIEFEQTQLSEALTALNPGDELVVTKLGSLGRQQLEIIARMHELQDADKHLKTLDGLINTRKFGKFHPTLLGLISGIAADELHKAKERRYKTTDNHEKKIQNSRGRPRTNPAKENLVLRLRNEGFSYRSIKEQTGLALSTIRRILVEGAVEVL